MTERPEKVVEWRPGRSEAITWNVVATGVTIVALPLFALPSLIRAGLASGSVKISLLDVLLVVAVTSVLVIAHEAIHALAMLGFGARPRFGVTVVGKVAPAFYATAPGYRFTRRQYLAVIVAPALLVSGIGLLACFGPWAGYLILPLALHLGGCTGDGFATWRVLHEPPSTKFEDLVDGIRFHRKAGAAQMQSRTGSFGPESGPV